MKPQIDYNFNKKVGNIDHKPYIYDTSDLIKADFDLYETPLDQYFTEYLARQDHFEQLITLN